MARIRAALAPTPGHRNGILLVPITPLVAESANTGRAPAARAPFSPTRWRAAEAPKES